IPAMLIAAAMASAPSPASAQPGQPGQSAPGSRFPPGAVQAAPPANAPAPVLPDGPTIDLNALIDRLGREMGREFIVDPRVPAEVRAGTASLEDADYETLLALLRVNGLIAVDAGDDQVLIMNEAEMRFMPTRLLQQDDSDVSDHEVVARVLEIPETERRDNEGNTVTFGAANLVPVLRPMASQSAQMAATSTSRLVIVDRYDNVRRLTAVIEELYD
ncbi:MAG: hypothetical protein ACWGPN_08930, partial [Gammaproteobacteria bacterium]